MNQTVSHGDFPLPSGEQHDFSNPPNRDIEVYAAVSIVLAVASISMLLRLYTRLVLKHAWEVEDSLVWIGYAATVAQDALILTITGSGPGKFIGAHIWNLKISYFTRNLLERSVATVLLCPTAKLFIKLSLFSLYLRLFRPSSLTRRLIYIGAATCSAFYLISFLVISISCVPDPNWPNDNPIWSVKVLQCTPLQLRMSLAQAAFGLISDIYLLVIPIQMVLRLQLALRRKIGVSGVFMTGVLGLACSITSLVLRAKGRSEYDQSWLNAPVWIFSSVEACTGIICVNTPVSAAVFTQTAKKPVWLRLPENMHYFSLRWPSWMSDSGKSTVDSTEDTTLPYHVLVEHRMCSSNESLDIPPMSTVHLNSNYGTEKDQYRVDISGGSSTNERWYGRSTR